MTVNVYCMLIQSFLAENDERKYVMSTVF